MGKKTTYPCNCFKCKGHPNAHPIWGYDVAKVKDMDCIACDKPIGSEPYVESSGMARFGIMEFVHKRCDKGGRHQRDTRRREAKMKKEELCQK